MRKIKKNNKINLPATFKKDEAYDHDLLTKVTLKVMHENINYNDSNFTFENIDKQSVKNSLKNCPILAFIDEDGDFDEHNMDINERTGEIKYHEQIIGVIPEQNNYRYETYDGLRYVVVDGYIYNTYASEALDIINDNEETKISMEIVVKSMNFVDNDIIDITDYRYTGITCLGRDVQSGMKNSVLTLDTYAHTDEFNKQFKEVKELVNFSLNKNSDSDTKEEEKEMPKSKKEIALQYTLTSMQLYNELDKATSEQKYTVNYWGDDYEMSKYYMRDFDESFVYAVDTQSNYNDVKIPYSMNGDNVQLDYDQISRIKYSPVDWDGQVDSEDDEVSENYSKKIVEEATNKFSEKLGQVNTEIESKNTEISEKVDAYIKLEEKVTNLETEIENKNSELESLQSFKLQIEKQETTDKINELFSNQAIVKNMSNDEVEEWRNKFESYSDFKTFSSDVKSFAFDKMTQSDNEKKTVEPNKFSNMGIITTDDEKIDSDDIWNQAKKNYKID